LEEAYADLDEGDVDALEAKISAVIAAGEDPKHPRILHLRALQSWNTGDVEEAADLFQAAIEAKPDEPRIYIEAGELYADLLDFDAAEDVLRSLLEREELELDVEQRAETLLLLAQARLSHVDSDPEEALELLDSIDASVHSDPAWICVRAAALAELDRGAEGVEMLTRAVAAEDDPDSGCELRYQLGLALRSIGKDAEAAVVLCELRELELALADVDAGEPLPGEQADDLKRKFEEVLESLPDRILKLVATAPISVSRWISEEQIRAGSDPRAVVLFETSGEIGAESETEPKLDGIILFRDMLIREIVDDADIANVLVEALVEELDRVFDIDGLVPG